MKAFVIYVGCQDTDVLRDSLSDNIELEKFEGTAPDTVDEHRKLFDGYHWNWPMDPVDNHRCMKTGLEKQAYFAVDQRKKEACSLSHMRLWKKCVELDEPIIIFEADAKMTRPFDEQEVAGYKLVGLNDPRGATKRAQLFHDIVSSTVGVQPTPIINMPGEMSPQGIAGNSAYYIEPDGATILLDKVKEYGMYPNDAYMCRELFPWIRVVYPYFTKVQGIASTTTR